MHEEIIVALITGGVTLIGVLVSNNRHDAVIDTKLESLTEEVRKHNNFAERIPVIENELKNATGRISIIEKRIS